MPFSINHFVNGKTTAIPYLSLVPNCLYKLTYTTIYGNYVDVYVKVLHRSGIPFNKLINSFLHSRIILGILLWLSSKYAPKYKGRSTYAYSFGQMKIWRKTLPGSILYVPLEQ